MNGTKELQINADAVKRGNVNADGTIWCHGQIVPVTDENARLVIEAAEDAIHYHTERMTIINEHPDGLSNDLLKELFGVDHRYHNWTADQLLATLKSRIDSSMQYIRDIREANKNRKECIKTEYPDADEFARLVGLTESEMFRAEEDAYRACPNCKRYRDAGSDLAHGKVGATDQIIALVQEEAK